MSKSFKRILMTLGTVEESVETQQEFCCIKKKRNNNIYQWKEMVVFKWCEKSLNDSIVFLSKTEIKHNKSWSKVILILIQSRQSLLNVSTVKCTAIASPR